jgi:hypothetical protein
MGTVQENIRACQDAYERVRGHCMCLAISDDGVYIRVIYPKGDWPGGHEGVQASYGVRIGKTEALNRIYDRMESDWINSFPGRS